MHREVHNHIEDLLAGAKQQNSADLVQHVDECGECREEVAGMREQSALLRELRAPAGVDLEPRPGFYARVLQRIEAEGPVSIWNLFIESAFGRRIAMASMALALLLGIYVISSERVAQDPFVATQPAPVSAPSVVAGHTALTQVDGEDGPGRVITQIDESVDAGPSSADAVLGNLVTYHEQ